MVLAMLRTQRHIAERAVVADVEACTCLTGKGGPGSVWDISVLLDEREHGPEVVDMNSEAIAYGLASGLLRLVAQNPAYVVQLLRWPAAAAPLSAASHRDLVALI